MKNIQNGSSAKIFRFTRMSFWFYLFVILGLVNTALLWALTKVPDHQSTGEVYISLIIIPPFLVVCVYHVIKAKRIIVSIEKLEVLRC